MLANRSATVRIPKDLAKACAYPSPASLLAPYGEIGLGRENSLTGGRASPMSAPPVEARTTRSTPARRAASSTWNVPTTLASKFITGSATDMTTEPAAARWMIDSIPAERGIEGAGVADVAFHQFGAHAVQVGRVAGGVVVEHADRMPAARQPPDQGRAHEAGSAGDQDTLGSHHGRFSHDR